MRSAIGFAVGLGIAAGLLTGCGPGKKLPDKPGTPTSEKKTEEPPAVPVASDPAARAVVERAMNAQTGGQWQRLEKVKTHVVHMKGTLNSPDGDVEAVRSIQVVWPGKMLSEWTTVHRGNRRVQTYWLSEGRGWARLPDENGQPRLRPLTPSELESGIPDVMAEQWVAHLVPFLEPSTVVFGLAALTAGDKTLDGVKVAIPNYPVYTAYFDRQTGYLVRIDYTAPEQGRLMNKVVELRDFKPDGEFIFPAGQVIKRSATLTASWEVSGPREFPERIDPAVFEVPKQ